MFKLLFGFCLIFFIFLSPDFASAKKISIAVIAYSTNFDLPDISKAYLQRQLTNLFPSSDYNIIKNDALTKDFKDKLSGHFSADPKKLDQIERHGLFELGKKYNYDYILVLTYNLDQSLRNENILNSKKAVQITLDSKLFQNKSGKYLYNNAITRTGGSIIKSFKDFSNMTDAIIKSANHCTDQLFSSLELPLVKRNLT